MKNSTYRLSSDPVSELVRSAFRAISEKIDGYEKSFYMVDDNDAATYLTDEEYSFWKSEKKKAFPNARNLR